MYLNNVRDSVKQVADVAPACFRLNIRFIIIIKDAVETVTRKITLCSEIDLFINHVYSSIIFLVKVDSTHTKNKQVSEWLCHEGLFSSALPVALTSQLAQGRCPGGSAKQEHHREKDQHRALRTRHVRFLSRRWSRSRSSGPSDLVQHRKVPNWFFQLRCILNGASTGFSMSSIQQIARSKTIINDSFFLNAVDTHFLLSFSGLLFYFVVITCKKRT